MKKIIRKILYIICCFLVIKIITIYCSNNLEFVEFLYSQKIYLNIAHTLSLVFNIFPFSFGELFVIFLVIILFYKLILIIKDFSIKRLINYMLNIIMLIITLQVIFWCFWGINNYRYTVDKLADINLTPSSIEKLNEVCIYLIEKTNNLRTSMPENDLGISFIPGNYEYVFNYSKIAYNYSSEFYNFIPKGYFCKPKAMLASELMCKMNYTGIYNPFTNEANINIMEPEFKIPFTVCHELAHQRGFAKENEANFISFLTCISSKNIYFEYSGYLSALIYCTNALYEADKNMYVNIRKSYSEGVIRDLNYLSSFWSKYKGKTAEIASKNNDRFLKSTNQPQGVKSYGMVVDLIIAYYGKLE